MNHSNYLVAKRSWAFGYAIRDISVATITFLFITSVALLAFQRQGPPPAMPAGAPATEFSSGRAMRYLESSGQKPHPIGSAEHAEVRTYILRTLEEIGLHPEIQNTSVINPKMGIPLRAGTVNNILARLKGTEGNKAVLLTCHYDSAPNSPGASDNSSAVAAMLETLRALKAGSALKNDVIFLFTDGEEAGLLGAKAFVDEHPWAKAVRLVLNFDARGSSGPVIMFETSDKNGWLIDEFAKASPRPVANSFAYEIYKILPNNTDFTALREGGLAGLNFAQIDSPAHYHNMLDRIGNLDERSLQHQGSYALSLARHFGNLNIESTTRNNSVYFDILSLVLARYSMVWVIPLSVMIVILFAVVATVGLRSKHLTYTGVALGILAFALNTVAVVLVIKAVWWGLSALPGQALEQGLVYNANLYLMAFVALSIAVTLACYILFRRKVAISNLALGAMFWWLVLLVITSFYVPGASYLLAWPLLFSLISLG